MDAVDPGGEMMRCSAQRPLRGARSHFRALAAVAAVAIAGAARGETGTPAGLLKNSDFKAGLSGWRSSGPAGAHAVDGGHVVFNAPPGNGQSHLDQEISLQPDQVVQASVRVRGDGTGLRPALRIADAEWQTLAYVETEADGEWRTLRTVVEPPPDGRIKLQLFGAGRSSRDSGAGQIRFADVRLERLSGDQARAAFEARITVEPAARGPRIDPRFFGVNTLFWIEDDDARADGRITAALRDLPCGLMRFPGGEVADNFHWRTTALDNIKEFPASEGPDKLCFDEFIAWRDEIGTEAICVVNLESGFLHGDIDAAVREAADWVRYSNIEKTYGVRYWEIGNETDLAGTRYPLRAAEYADAVARFSKAMKAVDPSILIGALGPFGADQTVYLDTLTPEGLAHMRAVPRGQRKDASKRNFATRDTPGPAWWPTVCSIAGGQFDFAIVHRYDGTRQSIGDVTAPAIRPGAALEQLDAFFRKATGSRVPLALTEWNLSRTVRMSPAEHGVSIAEMAMSYLEAGVEMANYWPMRYPSLKSSGFRAMLDHETHEPRPAYHALRMLGARAGDRVAAVRNDAHAVAAMATVNDAGDRITVFAASRHPRRAMRLRIAPFPSAKADAIVLRPVDKGQDARAEPLPLIRSGAVWEADLPPLGFARITISAAD